MSEQVCGDQELLQRFAEGELRGDQSQAVKAHAATCPACRAAIVEYKQLMWDLGRPAEVELPPELERSYTALMEAWKKEQKSGAPKSAVRLAPAWAAYSVSWTRSLPTAGAVRSLVRRTGAALVVRTLPRWMRRKGGARD